MHGEEVSPNRLTSEYNVVHKQIEDVAMLNKSTKDVMVCVFYICSYGCQSKILMALANST